MGKKRSIGVLAIVSAAAAVGLSFVVGGASAETGYKRSQPQASGTVTYQRGPVQRKAENSSAVVSLPATSEDQGTFHPLPPCRLVNTASSGGVLAANSTRSFYAFGDLSGQGGPVEGCDVPVTATALVVNVVAASPQGSGNLRAWAYGDAQPTASLVNFVKGVNIANSTSVGICRNLDNPVGICPIYDFSIRAERASTNVVVDVMGYYEGPLMARLWGDGTVEAASRSLDYVSYLNTGEYEVVFDRDVTGCAAMVTPDAHTGWDYDPMFVVVAPRFDQPNGIYVAIYAANGAPVDQSFSMVVHC